MAPTPAALRSNDGRGRTSSRTPADFVDGLGPQRTIAPAAKGVRYSDAELRAALIAFAAEHNGRVGSRAWEAWATRAPGRPRFAVLVRRLDPQTITTATGITIGPRRVPHLEMETRRRDARATLVELAALLGRTPRRVELEPARLSTLPGATVQVAARRERWLALDAILAAYGGNWSKAVRDAGLPQLSPAEDICIAMIDYRLRYGAWPTRSDIAMDRARRHPRTYPARAARYSEWGGPSATRIEKHFGTVAAAVKAARETRPDLR